MSRLGSVLSKILYYASTTVTCQHLYLLCLRGERFLLLESRIEELLEDSSIGFDILDSRAEYRALAVDREVPFR